MLVSRDIDVDDTAGVDVGWEEDRRELDLQGSIGSTQQLASLSKWHCALTSRLSSVRSTATPASTFPTVRETSMFAQGVFRCPAWLEARISRSEVQAGVWSCKATLSQNKEVIDILLADLNTTAATSPLVSRFYLYYDHAR
jgi:hypothetical protein